MYQKRSHTNEIYDFSILEKLLKVKTQGGPNYSTLNLDNDIGIGTVKLLKYSNGIRTIDFDLTLRETLEIPLNYTKLTTTQFIYVFKGDCKYKSENELINIKQFQTAISINKNEFNPKIILEKNTHIKLNIIDLKKNVCTKILAKEDCSFSIKTLAYLNNLNRSQKALLVGQCNINLSEHFKSYYQQISQIEDNGLLSIEGRISLILSNHFQLALEINNLNTDNNALNYTELIKVRELSDQIRLNPEVQYSLEFLSSESGLTPAKLQEGFKSLFNRTVSDFIRHIRLLKAEKLMCTTDLNISEIVYRIGFTSRSYFCKIFRREFNCSPKQYKNRTISIVN